MGSQWYRQVSPLRHSPGPEMLSFCWSVVEKEVMERRDRATVPVTKLNPLGLKCDFNVKSQNVWWGTLDTNCMSSAYQRILEDWFLKYRS